MVALASSAGGERAPKRTPVAIYNPGDEVRIRTASTPAVFVIVAVIHERRLHGEYVLYRVAAGSSEFLIDPANVILVGEATTQTGGPVMCECHGSTNEPAAEAVATAEQTEPEGTIEWVRTPDKTTWVSSEARFQITAVGNGFSADDSWCEGRLKPALLTSASAWCEARKEGQPLTWKEIGSGFSANLSGAHFRVNREGGNTFQGVDCRFTTSHRLRHSPFFHSPETARQWCEVRAACHAEGEGATATLHYVGPIPF